MVIVMCVLLIVMINNGYVIVILMIYNVKIVGFMFDNVG